LVDLLEGVNGAQCEKITALYYLSECHNVWSGKSNDFPFSDSSSMVISESVLRYSGIEEVLALYYEWHFINPHKESNIYVDRVSENKETLFDVVNIKPGLFGINVDLKKLLRFFQKKG